MKTKKVYLSVIVPVYNEASRLHNLWTIANYLKNKDFISELIVVNDGSIDQTAKLLADFTPKLGLRIITYQHNKGKGFAIKTGILASKGAYRVFSDIDLSVPIDQLEVFIKYLKNYPVVIASRRQQGSRLVVRQSKIREFMGRFFTFLSQVMLGVKITDFTCGFKCFEAEVAKAIFSKVTIDRWGFDSEVLFLAKSLGYPILEIPVTWRNDPYTRVKFPQDVYRSFLELMKIRWNSFRGVYRSK